TTLGETAYPPVLAEPAPECGARGARTGDLELQLCTDAPTFADDGVVHRQAGGAQVLPEPSRSDLFAEVGGPPGCLGGVVDVHGLVRTAVVRAVGLDVAPQSEPADPDRLGHRTLVDGSHADGTGVAV